ncbi:hypothetical protein OROMI_017982 [Orobanche minor]
MDDNSEKALELFLNIGLDEKTARKTFRKGGRLRTDLTALIHQAGVTDGCDRTIGNLLYMIADKYHGKALVHRPTLFKYIISSKIKSPVQLGAAYSFLTKTAPDELKLNELEEACGVGVDVSLEDIDRTVDEIFQDNMNTILEMRYRTDAELLIRSVLNRLQWADRKAVRRVIDEKMYELLGERTAADSGKPTEEESASEAVVEAVSHPSDEELNPFSIFPHPKQNFSFTPHPHAGDKWCIIPTYDYAHCIVDSLENVTHSLCTLEFETRRASYYWLLNSLGLYMPHVWEYSRLNITNTVMSKRKLNYFVTNAHVDGWDDPRLLTLAGLRRRGVTPTAINAFIRGLGITRSDGSMIHMSRLKHHITEELNTTSPRTMVVLDPLKVVITNLEPDEVIERDGRWWPNDKKKDDPSAIYKIPFSRVIHIEKSDFQKEDSEEYFGLAPGKIVLLRYGFLIKCTNVVLADDGETVCEVHVEYREGKTKPRGILHWVPEKDMVKVEIRKFEKLFNSENPAELNDDWLTDINPNSKVVVSDAYALSTIQDAVVGDRFQFERMGYFAVDKDSRPGKLVFNQTVTLKDGYKKGGK